MIVDRTLKPRHDDHVGRPPSYTAEQLADALVRSGGKYEPAAKLLGVDESSVRRAVLKNPDLLAGAAKLREESGYKFGRPTEIQPTREEFLKIWEDNGRVILAVARAIGCSQFVVRRLAFDYKVPGAPAKRRPGTR